MDATFEDLRRQYRDEAIQACKAAEKRGYEKAISESRALCDELTAKLSALNEECSKLKASGLKVMFSDVETRKSDSLLKYSMEEVYRNLKREFDGDPNISHLVARFKKALRQSTEVLSNRIREGLTPAEGNICFSKRSLAIRMPSPRPAIPVCFLCSIDGYSLKNNPGLFGSKYISYAITSHAKLFNTTKDLSDASAYKVNRRFSDFTVFEAKLRNSFHRCILPVLPPKEVSRQTTDDLVIRRRLRYLCTWLRYVAQHFRLARSRCFREFICDEGDIAAWADSMAEQAPGGGSTDEQPKCNEKNTRSIVLHSERERYDSRNTLGLVDKDYRHIHYFMMETLSSNKKLNLSLVEYKNALRTFQKSLCELSVMEDTSSEKKVVDSLADSVDLIHQQHCCLDNNLRNLMDSLRFFSQPCMESARALLDKCIAHEPLSDASVDFIHVLAMEWAHLRSFRQDELFKYIVELSENMKTQSKSTAGLIDSKLDDICTIESSPLMAETLSHAIHTESLFFDDMYQRLCDKVAALTDYGESERASLIHAKRVGLPQGVRRDPTKILGSIKPALSSTVDVVPSESEEKSNSFEKSKPAENDSKLNQNDDHDYETNRLQQEQDELKDELGQKQRSRRAGGSHSGTTNSQFRYRHQAPKKMAVAPVVIHSEANSTTVSSNFLAKSYGSSYFQKQSVKSTCTGTSSGQSVLSSPTVLNNTHQAAESYSWGDAQKNNINDTGQIPTFDDEIIFKKERQALNDGCYSDSDEVFSKPFGDPNVPNGWEEVKLPPAEGGGTYYYHKKTRVSRWERPDESISAALESRLIEEERRVEEAVQRRKEDREIAARIESEKTLALEQLQSKIQAILKKWLKPPGAVRERNIAELLSTVSEVVPLISGDVFACSDAVKCLSLKNSSPEDIRRCYMKIVRLIHPDKISASSGHEDRFLAEAAFVVLTESYQKFLNKQL